MPVLVESIESYDYEKVKKFIERAYNYFKPKLANRVILKPNFLKFDSSDSGCITHPSIVKAVTETFKNEGREVIIAEGGFWENSADKCYDAFGLREFANCININKGRFLKMRINGKALKEVEAGEIALEACKNSFVSIPKMKVHSLAQATLGIKNNIGFLKKPAVYMHFKIHQKLADLLKVLRPNFVIVDAITGGTGNELSPKPIRHGIMIAGDNVIEVDYVSAYLMGFNPKNIGYIKIAAEENGIDTGKIKVIGDIEGKIKNYKKSFIGRFLGLLGT